MSRIIEMMLRDFPEAHGVYQVSSEPIDKCTLLELVRARTGKVVEIVPDDSFVCDRTLDSSRFRSEFSYRPPSWDEMIRELAEEQ
jgi:dTDP-4-dehydrorhamnose reductase